MTGSHCKRGARVQRVALALLFAAATIARAQDVPLLSRGGTLRIAILGDVGEGTGRIATAVGRVHAVTPLDAVILTGDNFYPCGVQSASDPKWAVIRPLTALHLPLYPVLGNHDYCGNVSAQVGSKQWTMPAKEFALRNPIADFAMLDTDPYAMGRTRDAERSLVRFLHPSKAAWRIAVGHHTIVSSGWHGYFRKAERRRMQRLLPFLRREKVDLYVCGHDHHMELLDGRPRMLISGAGSTPVPALALRPNTLYPPVIRRELGFAVLVLDAKSMTIRFYDGNGREDGAPFVFPR
jgi:3',5'-cyclic AMP phosphodiesterase CpdA